MAKMTLATVPYVNAYPLVFGLEEASGSEVQLLSAPPSSLPSLLDSGEAQAVLVSSIEAIQRPNRTWIGDLCIGSDGPVESVRLFSQVPFSRIRRVALDQSSMTSNVLALILLEGLFGIKPETFTAPPVQTDMLAQADACLLIGDIGMTAPSDGLEVLDLGQGWKELTGLPFVWAGWIGSPGFDPALPGLLEKAYELSGCGAMPPDVSVSSFSVGRRSATLDQAVSESGWTRERLDHYLNAVMIYRLSHQMKQGREEFWSRSKALLKHKELIKGL
jgi:chorismate dehydratase